MSSEVCTTIYLLIDFVHKTFWWYPPNQDLDQSKCKMWILSKSTEFFCLLLTHESKHLNILCPILIFEFSKSKKSPISFALYQIAKCNLFIALPFIKLYLSKHDTDAITISTNYVLITK